MFAVSLVVPLLSSYFRDAGVDSKLYGLISSIYSLSQIASGFALAVLLDYIPKKNVLLVSFLGSGISYALVGLTSSHSLLFGSRLLVGLVKQTMTISTGMIRENSDSSVKRAEEMGQISALSKAVFVVGPTIGALLYKQNRSLPAIVSSACFAANAMVLLFIMPSNTIPIVNKSGDLKVAEKVNDKESFFQSARELLCLPDIGYVFVLRICIVFVESSMSSRNIMNYYESRFKLQTHQLGYIQSACMVLSILVQSFLISPIMKLFDSGLPSARYRLITCCVFCIICASLVEQCSDSFALYVSAGIVPSVAATTLLGALANSAFYDIVPAEHIGKGLGILSVCSSAIGVASPLYGSIVYDYFGGAANKGLVSASHYVLVLLVALARSGPFLPGRGLGKDNNSKKKTD